MKSKQDNATFNILSNIFSPNTRIGAYRYIISFIGVLLLGSILIAGQGENPVNAVAEIIKGSFGGKIQLGNTIRWATPCMLTGSAAIVAFKSGVTNLGIEGQMYIGALVAGILGCFVQLPPHLHAIVCVLCAGVAGAIWVIIPALLRLVFRIDEYVTSMMMNFLATLFCDYIVVWHVLPALNITTVTAATPNIHKTARLSTIIPGTSASTGFFIAVGIAVLVFILYKYTVVGYELKQVGENLQFARLGGVNVNKTFVSIFIISGFIAGICGGSEVSGGYYRYVSNFSMTMGWEGIMIANICNRNPIALIFVSLIWGALKTGAMAMERATSLNRLTVNLLQMIFVLLVSIDYRGIYYFFYNKKFKKTDAATLAINKE